MHDLAAAVERAAKSWHDEFESNESVFYTARSSASGATVFLSCHLQEGDGDSWKCAPLEEEDMMNHLESTIIACDNIRSQNRFHCKVLGKMKPDW